MKNTVFLLEDDASICGLIKVALEMNGIGFKAFATVGEFENAIKEEQPDVALLDIMLPDGSGLDVLKLLSKNIPKFPVLCYLRFQKKRIRSTV